MHESYSLDDLYYLVSHIYSQQNFDRHPSTTFAHFVEICGMLTSHDRKKIKDGFSLVDTLCKALGWFFPLMSKFHVTSIEDLIFRKYPYVCPYCRKCPHDESICKNLHGVNDKTVNQTELISLYEANLSKKPKSLDAWQKMFQEIYPRTLYDQSGRSILGLLEEIGEFAEAMRVFDRHPKYFAGEAADIFSYLMGIANEYTVRESIENPNNVFHLNNEFILRYPGLCKHCGYQICLCPTIPEATVGRMSKEPPIKDFSKMFSLVPKTLEERAKETSEKILNSLGGVEGILSKFPFDRGETNSALVQLCLRLAEITSEINPSASNTFRSVALTASLSQTLAGTSVTHGKIDDAIADLKLLLPDFINIIENVGELKRPVMTSIIGAILKENKE